MRPEAAGDSYAAQPPAGGHLSHHGEFVRSVFVSARRSGAAIEHDAFLELPRLLAIALTHAHTHTYLHA